jgi:hypothetical protein
LSLSTKGHGQVEGFEHIRRLYNLRDTFLMSNKKILYKSNINPSIRSVIKGGVNYDLKVALTVRPINANQSINLRNLL